MFAQFEREIIIDRVIAGMERKAAHGKWTSGTRPYGYQVNPQTDTLIAHPQEAPILRQIFDLYAQTQAGTRAIAAQLNDRGARNRTGKPWSGGTIARLLASRVYLGEKVFRTITTPDAHPALVDPHLFQQVQELLTQRGETTSRRPASKPLYLLAASSPAAPAAAATPAAPPAAATPTTSAPGEAATAPTPATAHACAPITSNARSSPRCWPPMPTPTWSPPP